jgi:hypothetical protein
MIANAVRRMSPVQRLVMLVLVVVLADFSIPDGCDCGPNDITRTAAVSLHGGN